MPPFPRITATELRTKLVSLGFSKDRQKGSHLLLRHQDDPSRFAVVSMHSKGIVPPGTLKHILSTAKVTVEELGKA